MVDIGILKNLGFIFAATKEWKIFPVRESAGKMLSPSSMSLYVNCH